MANFRFKPESILAFSCDGIGTSSGGQHAVECFKEYLSLAGIETDSRGFLNTDQFMTQYLASDETKKLLNEQFKDQYTDQSKNMYYGFLHNNASGSVSSMGYVVLPFKNNGKNVKIVLPGTLIHMQKRYSSTTPMTGTVQRTAEKLTIGDKTLYKDSFDKSVVPLYLAMLVQGGGGGGSSSENLTSGRGGGGGGTNYGMVSLIENPNLVFVVGAGGSGGFHNEGTDSGTSANHDGKEGGFSYVFGDNFGIYVYGGSGGIAGSNTKASGGDFDQTNGYLIFRADNGEIIDGVKGGSGSVNVDNTGSSVSRTRLSAVSEVSLFSAAAFYLNNATYSPGTSHSPGGGGGGATFFGSGASGGNLADAGASGSAGSGKGGGGGGYHVGMWIDGGKGGSGRVEFFC